MKYAELTKASGPLDRSVETAGKAVTVVVSVLCAFGDTPAAPILIGAKAMLGKALQIFVPRGPSA